MEFELCIPRTCYIN